MLPMALRQTGLCVVFFISGSWSTPLPFYSSLEGSTDEEELSNFTFFVSTGTVSSEYQTTPVGPTHVETDFLSQVVLFLEENMLLILVFGSLTLLLFLIICGAICMSRRHKVNAYYPSSFPSKMYVDHRDKTGGAKSFNEVPEKPAPEQRSEPVDSHRQLQADIMRAAKSLRTPNKSVDAAAEGSGPCQKVKEHSPEDSAKPDGSIQEKHPQQPQQQQHPHPQPQPQPQQLQSPPEEKEQSEGPYSPAAASLQPTLPEHPEEEEAAQLETGRSLRPSSLHLHNDSATLQLIAGEKTAF